MKNAQATAEVFLTAFRALPMPQREAVLKGIFSGEEFQTDLLDVARWLGRRRERSIPYRKVREDLKQAGRL